MAKRIYGLSEEDRRKIVHDLEQRMKLRQNDPDDLPDFTDGAPEVYVAKAPCGEPIPAMVGREPGWRYCCIFRLEQLRHGEDVTSEITPVRGPNGKPYREVVFNIYDEEIPDTEYFRIERDKYGCWLAERPKTKAPGGGNGGNGGDGDNGGDGGNGEGSSPTTIAPGGSITTTTSTAAPECNGRCRWIWDNDAKVWNLDTDYGVCSVASTTSSSTTSSSTTSTSPGPTSSTTTDGPTTTSTTEQPSTTSSTTTTCECPPITTSTTEQPSTTTTSSTTTTEGPTTTTTGGPTTTTSGLPTTTTSEPPTTTTSGPCQCLYPTYCGSEDCEITYTFCASGGTNNPPDCSHLTTTTTTSEPASTTTSSTEPCSGDCEIHWNSELNFWEVSVNNCTGGCQCEIPEDWTGGPVDLTVDCVHPPTTTTSTEDPCATTTTTTAVYRPECPRDGCQWYKHPVFGWVAIRYACHPSCPCETPDFNDPEISSLPDCSTITRSCETTPPPPPTSTTGPYCKNSCLWTCDGMGNWVRIIDNCDGNRPCRCGPPSKDSCTLCGKDEETPCTMGPTTTSTTSEPTTTQHPCYTTTTTEGPTTTTSTTTTNCITSTCKWSWDALATDWVLVEDNCPPDCPCTYTKPAEAGEECETVTRHCGLLPSTTTTSSTTTTEGPTTTTTLTCASSGICNWSWNAASQCWTLMNSGCLEGCVCQNPCSLGSFDGQVMAHGCTSPSEQIDCGGMGGDCASTTTTQAPTTTIPTTTTTTTTSGGSTTTTSGGSTTTTSGGSTTTTSGGSTTSTTLGYDSVAWRCASPSNCDPGMGRFCFYGTHNEMISQWFDCSTQAGGPWSTLEDCEASCGTTSGPSTTTTTTAGPTTTSTTYACTGTRSYECMEGFEGEDTVYNWSELGGATCNGAPCFSEDGPAACCGSNNVGAVEVIPCRNDQDCGRAGCVWRRVAGTWVLENDSCPSGCPCNGSAPPGGSPVDGSVCFKTCGT